MYRVTRQSNDQLDCTSRVGNHATARQGGYLGRGVGGRGRIGVVRGETRTDTRRLQDFGVGGRQPIIARRCPPVPASVLGAVRELRILQIVR